jgi:kynureninase
MTNFHQTRDLFHLPDGMIYLDGNSLGPLPKATSDRVAQAVTDEWGAHLISAWNSCGWMQMPRALGDRIGRLIGAEPGHTVVGDTLSIKVFQALAAALRLNPERRVILSDNGNFPSDLYIAQGLIRLLDRDYELRVVAPEDIEANITDDIAVTLITEVDYRTGRRHDMKALTAKAHAHGALAIWDLAHSAGAFPVYLSDCNADFAVGCTYKYLNAGPGAPAFIYTAPKHAAQAEPALAGWMGHDAPFAIEQDYRPGQGIERMRVGTPPVIQMAALDAALQIWDQVDMEALRTRSLELTDRFIAAVETTCPDLELATPRDHAMRGSQVSFRHAEGYAVMQALIAQGVVGDFRAPDILRFGFTPLYTTDQDVDRAAEILAEILDQRLWDTPEFKARKAVT